jgi:hypothetical protein
MRPFLRPLLGPLEDASPWHNHGPKGRSKDEVQFKMHHSVSAER